MRKIIQIHGILALCDDGTVWQYHAATSGYRPWAKDGDQFFKADAGWVQLPPIPQDETTEKIAEILS